MSESLEERIAVLETKTSNQEDRIVQLEKNREDMLELKYSVKEISTKVDEFVTSQTETNSVLSEAVSLLKDKTVELENAPKNFLWGITINSLKSFIPKIIPWIIIGGYAIYRFIETYATK